MQTVVLKYLVHNNAAQIAIYFEKDKQLNELVKKLPLVKWSQSNKCWYLPLSKAHYQQILHTFNAIAHVNSSLLMAHFNTPKKPENKTTTIIASKKSTAATARLYAVNKQVLPAMQQHLQLKGYSPSTQKTYLNEMQQFLQTIKKHPADEFTTQRLKDYLQYCHNELKLSENTLHSRMNAMKFYYEQVLKKEKLFWEIPRPKKPLILPKVLGEAELGKLFKALDNKKHKAMLFTAYSAGLRVSEVAALQIAHIDSDRMQICIKAAKGKKDRYVTLSPVLLDILRDYMQHYTLYQPLINWTFFQR